MKSQASQQSGFIKTIILIVAAIIVLKFVFHVDILSYLTSGTVGVWLSYVEKVFVAIWNTMLHPLFIFIKSLVGQK